MTENKSTLYSLTMRLEQLPLIKQFSDYTVPPSHKQMHESLHDLLLADDALKENLDDAENQLQVITSRVDIYEQAQTIPSYVGSALTGAAVAFAGGIVSYLSDSNSLMEQGAYVLFLGGTFHTVRSTMLELLSHSYNRIADKILPEELLADVYTR